MAGLIGLTASLATAVNSLPRVEPADLYRAQNLLPFMLTNDLAQDRLGKPWKFGEKSKCNFTYFSPEAKAVTCEEKGLSFKTSGEKVIIGWGNYDGRQAKGERLTTYSGWNEIELKVKQTATSSVWKIDLWNNGAKGGGEVAFWSVPTDAKTVAGADWQVVRFRPFRLGGADGFGLTIQGPADNTIEIESLRITQTTGQGCFRKEFELPKGKIWRAVGEKNGQAQLMVNGKPVEIPLGWRGMPMAPVDLAPYLIPGRKNVICLLARQAPSDRNPPLAYFQGRVIMDNGEVISLDTDAEWRGQGPEEKGWTEPEFNASRWPAPVVANVDATYLTRRWPVYDGRLLLENPGKDPQLYFDDAAPVRVTVRIPEGLAKDQPAVRWILRRVARENERTEVGRGEMTQGEKHSQSSSLLYGVDVDQRPSGVYTLEVELTAGGKLLERRFEEPLMVVGRLPMKEVAGNAFGDGLDLELESVIDFTNPSDPHRWVESKGHRYPFTEPVVGVTEPKIVKRGDLVYREVTDDGVRANFSYRFEFQRPGSWYLMVLEYPNDAERWIGVSVTAAVRTPAESSLQPWRRTTTGGYSSQDGPSLVTGDKYPLDGKMHELRWLHWADPEIHTLDIVNLHRLRAAAARVRIYRVKELPAVKIQASGERFFGIHTEDSYKLGVTFSDTEPGKSQQRYQNLGYDMVARFTERLRWHFDACRNYTEYLRFTGQNLHVEGAFHYSESPDLSFMLPERMPGDGRLLQDIREPLVRFFERNGITMYSMVEYVCYDSLRAASGVTDQDVARGADTISFVSKDGKQGGWQINPNHPAAEAGYLNVADDLAAKFAFSPAWKGIYYSPTTVDGGWGPSVLAPMSAPLDYDYSDATITLFEKDTGIKTPGEAKDPQRFEKRYLFLTSDTYREKWIDWRCQKMGGYLTKTRDRLRKHRPDLNVLCGYHICGEPIQYWLAESKQSYRDYNRQLGMDPSTVKNEPGIWFGRYVYPTGPASDGRPYHWEHFVGPEPIAYYDVSPNRITVMNTCWHELATLAPGVSQGKADKVQPPDWPIPGNVSRFISQAHDDNVLEPFAQVMIGSDPDILLFGFTDMNIINSREQQVREVAKVITVLPQGKFESVLGTADFQHNLALRALNQGSALWFYAVNPGYWPIQGTVTLSGKAAVVTPGDGVPVATREENGKTVVPVALKPYGLMAFKASDQLSVNSNQSEKDKSKIQNPADSGTSPKLAPLSAGSKIRIESWTNAPLAEADLAHMRHITQETAARLDNPAVALALTRAERDFLREIIKRAEAHLQAGAYAAAWSALTNWKFWTLKQNLLAAEKFSARLPGRPADVAALDSWERPELAVATVQGAAPVVDGRLDEAAWAAAPASYRFLSIGAGSAPYLGIPVVDTSVQACHDRDKLYLALRMADPDVKALRKTAAPDNPVQVLRKYDDTMVMFLNPAGNRVRQFAVNAGGVKYFSGSGAWAAAKEDLLARAWDAAVSVTNGVWTLEAAIPFASLDEPAPVSGAQWRANFIRRFREFNLPESYWARIKNGWADAERYGTLSFQ